MPKQTDSDTTEKKPRNYDVAKGRRATRAALMTYLLDNSAANAKALATECNTLLNALES